MMRILMTGGTGLIGSCFIQRFSASHDFTVLARKPQAAARKLGKNVRVLASLSELEHLDLFDAVINLAGEPIADKRWSDAQKERIQNSRWQTTQKLVSLIQASARPPRTFISGSAIGYYGRQSSEPVTETRGVPHDEFSHELCARWEQIANSAASAETRVCLLRTGVVLAKHGGALKKMLPPFYFGLGGPIGNGQQMMSWIHLHDMVNAIEFLLTHDECAGAYNMTAPTPVSNKVFSTTIGKVLNRPTFMRVPAPAMRLIFGEMAEDLLLNGQAVLPERLHAAGFEFSYPELEPALRQLLKGE